LGQPASQPGEFPSVWSVPVLPADFLAQSGAICLRSLAHVFLSEPEREEWRALKGTVRSRIDWLFGRAAVKEAVRHWVHEQTGQLLYPSDVVVGHDVGGALVIQGWWCDRLIAAPKVSLTQDRSTCVASVEHPAHSTHHPDLNFQTFASKELIQQ